MGYQNIELPLKYKKMKFFVHKIISGGQTGVDRAGLDVAIVLDIPHGGWCPRERKAEDGIIPIKYQLEETASDEYSERTRLNIRNSDGTLILVPNLPIRVTDGTLLTKEEAEAKRKPLLIVDLSSETLADTVIKWINEHDIKILNIAGSRESQSPRIYESSSKFLTEIFGRGLTHSDVPVGSCCKK